MPLNQEDAGLQGVRTAITHIHSQETNLNQAKDMLQEVEEIAERRLQRGNDQAAAVSRIASAPDRASDRQHDPNSAGAWTTRLIQAHRNPTYAAVYHAITEATLAVQQSNGEITSTGAAVVIATIEVMLRRASAIQHEQREYDRLIALAAALQRSGLANLDAAGSVMRPAAAEAVIRLIQYGDGARQGGNTPVWRRDSQGIPRLKTFRMDTAESAAALAEYHDDPDGATRQAQELAAEWRHSDWALTRGDLTPGDFRWQMATIGEFSPDERTVLSEAGDQGQTIIAQREATNTSWDSTIATLATERKDDDPYSPINEMNLMRAALRDIRDQQPDDHDEQDGRDHTHAALDLACRIMTTAARKRYDAGRRCADAIAAAAAGQALRLTTEIAAQQARLASTGHEKWSDALWANEVYRAIAAGLPEQLAHRQRAQAAIETTLTETSAIKTLQGRGTQRQPNGHLGTK